MKNAAFCVLLVLIGSDFQPDRDYRSFHSEATVIDFHNDCVMRILKGEDLSKPTGRGHSDLPRFMAGGVDVQIFSIFVPPGSTRKSYFRQAEEQIDSVESFVRRNAGIINLVRTSGEILQSVRDGKFGVMLGMEGGHPIENSVDRLKYFYDRGVRYVTLTWNNSTDWASSANDEEGKSDKSVRKGLSPLGVEIVKKMNDLGMIVDVSHLGESSFWNVLKVTKKPIIASHSSVWRLCPNRRNLSDEQLKAIANNGGLVGINFAPFFLDSGFAVREKRLRETNKARIDSFLSEREKNVSLKDVAVNEFLGEDYKKIRPQLSKLIDHIDYIVRLIGVDHVGLGSDFDGISTTPLEMDDVSCFPNITRELLNRGYSEGDIKKILGENFIRVLKSQETK